MNFFGEYNFTIIAKSFAALTIICKNTSYFLMLSRIDLFVVSSFAFDE